MFFWEFRKNVNIEEGVYLGTCVDDFFYLPNFEITKRGEIKITKHMRNQNE